MALKTFGSCLIVVLFIVSAEQDTLQIETGNITDSNPILNNTCISNPCQDGATCLPTVAGHLCECQDSYNSTNCTTIPSPTGVVCQPELDNERTDHLCAPSLHIRCRRNCKWRANVQDIVGLTVECLGCDLRHYDIQWTLNVSLDWERDTGTGRNHRALSIYPDVLQAATVYLVNANATGKSPDSLSLGASYILHMSRPPRGGLCQVVPREGFVMIDLFSVTCVKFFDPSVPLNYLFYLNPDTSTGKHGQLLYMSVDEPVMPSIHLPVGPAHNNYISIIRVAIADSLAASIYVDLHVRILPKKKIQLRDLQLLKKYIAHTQGFVSVSSLDISNKTSTNVSANAALNGTLHGCPNLEVFINSSSANETFTNSTPPNLEFSNGAFLNETLPRSINPDCKLSKDAVLDADSDNYALSEGIFSSLESSTSTFKDEFVSTISFALSVSSIVTSTLQFGDLENQVQDAVVKRVSDLQPRNMASVAQKASCLDQLTASNHTLGGGTQLGVIRSYSEMAKLLKNVSESLNEENSQDILAGRPEFIESAAWIVFNGSLTFVEKIIAEEEHLTAEIAGECLRTVEDVASALMSLKVPGHRSIEAHTRDLSMQLKKDFFYHFSGATFHLRSDITDKGGGRMRAVRLPDIMGTIDTSPEPVIGMKLMYASHTLYDRYKMVNESVPTDFVDLRLSNEDGSPRSMHGLSHPVSITMPLYIDEDNVRNVTLALPGGSGEIDPDDATIFSLQVPQRKQYYVMLSLLGVATHMSFILVIKLDAMPDLWDFYGGERINRNAIMFTVNFTHGRTINVTRSNGPGVENLIKRNGSIYILGRTYNSKQTGSLFFGLMPTTYDKDLCEQCRKVSDERCGFCIPRSVNESLDSVLMQVSVALPDCLYWDESDRKWNNYGCKVSAETTPASLVCDCNHLSLYRGKWYVVPQKVELTKLTLIFEIIYNPVVLMVVLGAWSIYFALLAWARIKDQKDLANRSVTILADNDPKDRHYYLLTVLTGWKNQAGTTSVVALYMNGSDGSSRTHVMIDEDKELFLTGAEDWFLIAEPHNLGELDTINVWIDCSGLFPAWYLNQITVHDIQTDEVWHFICDHWLTPDPDAGLIERQLNANHDMSFFYAFSVKAIQNMRDQHLWMSIFACPPHSTFTRVQRLSCGFSFVMTAMLVNIMFYGRLVNSTDYMIIRNVEISVTQLIIGTESALISIPINMAIVMIFRNIKERQLLSRQQLNHYMSSNSYMLDTDDPQVYDASGDNGRESDVSLMEEITTATSFGDGNAQESDVGEPEENVHLCGVTGAKETTGYSGVTKTEDDRQRFSVMKAGGNRVHFDISNLDEERRHSDVMKLERKRRLSNVTKTEEKMRHCDLTNRKENTAHAHAKKTMDERRYSCVSETNDNKKYSDVWKIGENRRHSIVAKTEENRQYSDFTKADKKKRYSDVMPIQKKSRFPHVIMSLGNGRKSEENRRCSDETATQKDKQFSDVTKREGNKQHTIVTKTEGNRQLSYTSKKEGNKRYSVVTGTGENRQHSDVMKTVENRRCSHAVKSDGNSENPAVTKTEGHRKHSDVREKEEKRRHLDVTQTEKRKEHSSVLTTEKKSRLSHVMMTLGNIRKSVAMPSQGCTQQFDTTTTEGNMRRSGVTKNKPNAGVTKTYETRRYSDVRAKEELRRHPDVIKTGDNRRRSEVMKTRHNRRDSVVTKLQDIRRQSCVMNAEADRRKSKASPTREKASRSVSFALRELNINNASSRHSVAVETTASETDDNSDKADMFNLDMTSSAMSTVTRSVSLGSLGTGVSSYDAHRTYGRAWPAKELCGKQSDTTERMRLLHSPSCGSKNKAVFNRDRVDQSIANSVFSYSLSSSSSSYSSDDRACSSESSYDDLPDNIISDRRRTISVDACIGTGEFVVDTSGGGDNEGGDGRRGGRDVGCGGDDGRHDGESSSSCSFCSKEDAVLIALYRSEKTVCGRKSNAYKATKIQKRLPWWFVYIGWSLAITSCLLSSYVVVMYSLTYGYAASMSWAVSFFTTLTQNLGVIQPLKVASVVGFLTFLFRNPVQPVSDLSQFASISKDDVALVMKQKCKNRPDQSLYSPPDHETISPIVSRLRWENEMWEKFWSISIYIIVTSLILTIVYGQKEPMSINLTTNVNNMFVASTFTNGQKFYEVNNIKKMWDYFETTLVPALSDNGTQNVIDKFNYLIGPARIRQIRTRPVSVTNECNFKTWESLLNPNNCSDKYSVDRNSYNTSWTPMDRPDYNDSSWTYYEESVWNAAFFPARHRSYTPGGYLVLLHSNMQSAQKETLRTLAGQNWVDKYTQAVLVEFTIFNGALNLFSTVIMAFEFVESGIIDPYRVILTGKLYILRTVRDLWIVACCVAYVLFTIRKTWHLVRKTRRTCKRGVKHLTVWILIDWTIVLLTYIGTVTYFMRQLAIEWTMRLVVASRQQEYISFYMIAYWDYVFMYVGSAALSLSIFNLLKMINLSQHVLKVQSTLRRAIKILMRAFAAFVVTFVLFVCIFMIVFGPTCRTYSTWKLSTMNVFNLCLCKLRYSGGQCINPYRPMEILLLIVVVCSVIFVWTPMMRAMFASTHFDTIVKAEEMREEGEFFKFIWSRLHVWVGLWTTKMYAENIIADELAEEERCHKIKKRIALRESVYGEHIRRAKKGRWNMKDEDNVTRQMPKYVDPKRSHP